ATGGYDGLDPGGGYIAYVNSLLIGLGWPLEVAIVAGLLAAISRRDRAMVVVAALPLSMIAVLGAQQMYFARFLLPTLPALLVVAAALLDSVLAMQPLLGVVAAVLVAGPTLVDAVRFDVLLTQPDTR